MAHLEETDSANASAVVAAHDDSDVALPTSADSKPKSAVSVLAPASKSDKISQKGDEENDDKNEEKDDEEEEGDEVEEEYEIEAIIDAKRNVVKQGEYAYLVKWKGYGPAHNSWVNEDDTGNCRDLIDEFFRNKVKSQPSKPYQRISRMSTGKAKGQVDSPATSGKRGRGARGLGTASKTPEVEEEDEGMNDDEEESTKRSKRKRRSSHGIANGTTSTGSAKAVKRSQKDDDDVSMADATNDAEDIAEPETRYKTMKDIKLSSEKNWEKYVKEITTVERDENDLMIYFQTVDDQHVREPSSKCAQRFPQKLIQFYEAHLRWKVADGEVET